MFTDGADTNLPRQPFDSSLPYQTVWLLPIHCRERRRGHEAEKKQEGKGEVRERREERDSLLPNISSAQVSEGTWRWCSHMASVPRAHRL